MNFLVFLGFSLFFWFFLDFFLNFVSVGYRSSGTFYVEKMEPTQEDDINKLPPAFIVKARAQKLPKSDFGLKGGSSGN